MKVQRLQCAAGWLAVLAILVTHVSCSTRGLSHVATAVHDSQSAYSVLSSQPHKFSTLTSLVDKASIGLINFTDVLSDMRQNLTVFAPSNAAWGKLNFSSYNKDWALYNNVTTIITVLSTHIVAFAITSSQLSTYSSAPSILGPRLFLADIGAPLVKSPVSIAAVTATHICGNTVVHVIDTVLLPAPLPKPETRNPGYEAHNGHDDEEDEDHDEEREDGFYQMQIRPANFSVLVQMINHVSDEAARNKNLTDWRSILRGTVRPFTFFAPNNSAMQDLMKSVGNLSSAVLSNANFQNVFLRAHFIGVKASSFTPYTNTTLTALNGKAVRISATRIETNDITYRVANRNTPSELYMSYPGIDACNGIMYPVNGGVLLPVPREELASLLSSS